MHDISIKKSVLTLQVYIDSVWRDMAELYFNKDYELETMEYLTDYVVDFFEQTNAKAISINYPVNVFIENAELLMTTLGDIMPAGASRRYWLEALDIKHLPLSHQNYLLLKNGAISPIGNLRIKESIPKIQNERYFSLQVVKNRQSDFLEYANQTGAIVGGATGAGGEAPKLLLKRRDEQVWIDNLQLGLDCDVAYLVKYPRGNYSDLDCDILRAEYHYYHELHTLGFSTIDIELMKLEEGERYPSLWLPRFDMKFENGKWKRYAMESVYSMLKKYGGNLDHEQTIRQLLNVISNSQFANHFDSQRFVIEWVKRDLLNIAFGNSDNHGRNTAFLRDDKQIWLSPIYDFAPMRADPEGIIRTATWSRREEPPQELADEYRFDKIADSLADLIEPNALLQELKMLANQLIDLKSRLSKRGVPISILDFPAIGFDYLPEKLQRWGLV
ncbi:type II toxin-antitoxin system HipA family toxin [Conservatibacter flavescens]|uniref:Toxin HipA n=1 Tax=Conservatibacter flavescens TaxID=28161 RepID=A0A2M8S392_9PAST|nr:HipA domain-containing protein [Conservatibacter flavescens]PJG85623.1 toxin HipA [Conservatibacter flavescens]